MSTNRKMQERWLDKVWLGLFGESGELITPGQIRREGLDRARVRAAELGAIVASEREFELLHSGQKVVNYSGQMIDAIAVGDIPMSSIIERPRADEDAIFARLAKPAQLLQSVAHEVNFLDLKRSLNIRRIALLAEEEVLTSFSAHALPQRPLDAQWQQRWRQLAQDIYSPALQRLWARLLVREVAAPGHFPLATLNALADIGENSLAGLQLLARYNFGDFLFDARGRYFQPQLHDVWLESAVEWGLLQPLQEKCWITLKVRPGEQEPLLLVSHRRALQLFGLGDKGVPIPVLLTTPIGKQLFSLCKSEADLAYLLDLAAYLNAIGVQVSLGDWQPLRRHFDKKFDFA